MKWLKHLWLSRPFFRWSRIRPGDVVTLKGQSYPMTVTLSKPLSVELKSDDMVSEMIHTTVRMILPRRTLQKTAKTVNSRRVVTWL